MTVVRDGESWVELTVRSGVHVHAWHGKPTLPVVEGYYRELANIVAEGKEMVLLTDTTHAGVPSAQVRKCIGDLQTALEPRLRPLAIGNVVVVQSSLIRGVLTALKWLVPSLEEVTYAGTLEEGLQVAAGIREHWRA